MSSTELLVQVSQKNGRVALANDLCTFLGPFIFRWRDANYRVSGDELNTFLADLVAKLQAESR